MTIAEQLIQRGMERGRQEGLYTILMNLMKNLRDKTKVAQLTGLSPKEVDLLLEKHGQAEH